MPLKSALSRPSGLSVRQNKPYGTHSFGWPPPNSSYSNSSKLGKKSKRLNNSGKPVLTRPNSVLSASQEAQRRANPGALAKEADTSTNQAGTLAGTT